jgi:hypothetical protein
MSMEIDSSSYPQLETGMLLQSLLMYLHGSDDRLYEGLEEPSGITLNAATQLFCSCAKIWFPKVGYLIDALNSSCLRARSGP